MNSVETAASTVVRLNHLGLNLDTNASKITIKLVGFNELVTVNYEYNRLVNSIGENSRYLEDANGKPVLTQEFYSTFKDALKLPDDLTSLEIVFEVDCISMVRTEYALNSGSLDNLEGYTTITREQHRSKAADKVTEFIKSLRKDVNVRPI